MDSLTHIVLGACIGEAMLGNKIGKKALLAGALAQTIPDIDFIAALWNSPANNLLAHRGFTHSVLFIIIIAPLLALLSERWHRPHDISTRKWIGFFACNLVVHIILDAFNVYGVGWFEPFSHYRVSFNTLFVVDPFFSIWPGIAFTALLLLPQKKKGRMKWVKLGLVLPALYLAVAVMNKQIIDKEISSFIEKQNISFKRFFSTPAPMNIFLWNIVIENDSGYNIGYRSVFDSKGKFSYNFFPRNDYLLDSLAGREDLFQLRRFSKGYYTAAYWNDTLVFNDIRFGQETGWADPHANFVFHFYLNSPAANTLVMQRGRFSRWDWKAMKMFIKRIGGD